MGRKWIKKIVSASLIASMVLSALPNLSGLPNCGKVGVEPKEVLAEVSGLSEGSSRNVLNSVNFVASDTPVKGNWVGISEIGCFEDDVKGYLHYFTVENWGTSDKDMYASQNIWLYRGWYKMYFDIESETDTLFKAYPYVNGKINTTSVVSNDTTKRTLEYSFEVYSAGYYDIGGYFETVKDSKVNIDKFGLYCTSLVGSESVVYDVSKSHYMNNNNFIKGVDISSIISEEASGVTYNEGTEKDVFRILKNNGVNYVRIRIWNDPFDSDGTPYGGGVNDAETAVMIAQRATDAGLGVFLSFHLSDFWADPGEQIVPKDWTDYNVIQKASSASTFVTDTISRVKETGANVGIVTIGNENNWSGIAGTGATQDDNFGDYISIVKSCYTAVKEIDNSILVGIHVTPEGNAIKWQAINLAKADSSFLTDFCDVYSISMYPYLKNHGTEQVQFKAIANELSNIASTYGCYTMITEFNWPWTGDPIDGSWELARDGCDYTLGSGSDLISVVGQSTVINTMYNTFSGVTNMLGMFYWEPAWLPVGNTGGGCAMNEATWLTFGNGVATYSGATYLGWDVYVEEINGPAYDKDKIEYIAKGTEADSKALFSVTGSPWPSLSALGNLTTDTSAVQEVKAQVSTPSDGKVALRFVGTFNESDLTNYDNVGFKYEYSDGTHYTVLKDYEGDNLYSSVIANSETVDAPDGGALYAYTIRNIPATGTYYFKVIPKADGNKYDQYAAKYYKLEDGVLSVIKPWEYLGSNSKITHSKMNGTTINNSTAYGEVTIGKFELYPDSIK